LPLRAAAWTIVPVALVAIGSVPATIEFDLKAVEAQHIITVTLGGVLLVTALFLITGRSIRTLC
jgi:hypothetical protein